MRHARYARLYDGILNHPKFAGLDPRAGWLWTLSLAYCHDQLTDGFVPEAQPARLLGVAPKRANMLADLLVRRGLFERVDPGGWRLHDYLEWNDSKEDVLAEQARQAERKRRSRHGGSHAARHAGQDADATRDGHAQSSTVQNYPLPPRVRGTNPRALATNPRALVDSIVSEDGVETLTAPRGELPKGCVIRDGLPALNLPAAWMHADGCTRTERLADVHPDRRRQCAAHRAG